MGHGLFFKVFLGAALALATSTGEAKSLPSSVQSLVNPYLLPDNHPIKPSLDYLFSMNRVILNLKTLEKAGFKKCKPRKFTKLIVTKHPAFPGYIFKLYLDAQGFHKDQPEYHYWVLRINGAELIRQEIAATNVGHLFKVPKKWIYALPSKPQPPRGYAAKHFILVEEDMDILSDKENKNLWGSDHITHQFLDEVYAILSKIGLHDCAKPDNIPFSKDGRIAFIDTQSYGLKVEYKKLNEFLSKENQQYWKSITEQ